MWVIIVFDNFLSFVAVSNYLLFILPYNLCSDIHLHSSSGSLIAVSFCPSSIPPPPNVKAPFSHYTSHKFQLYLSHSKYIYILFFVFAFLKTSSLFTWYPQHHSVGPIYGLNCRTCIW